MKSIAYRGELTATSELGRGSRFVFTVPVVAAPAERPTERIEAELSVVDAWPAWDFLVFRISGPARITTNRE